MTDPAEASSSSSGGDAAETPVAPTEASGRRPEGGGSTTPPTDADAPRAAGTTTTTTTEDERTAKNGRGSKISFAPEGAIEMTDDAHEAAEDELLFGEPPVSILRVPSRVADVAPAPEQAASVPPLRRMGSRALSWQDETGGGLVEVHYKEALHYSLHSRDREVVRRQQLRAGCAVDADVVDGVDARRCCVIS
mmetsp:Transcript_21021/g.83816  ORF Transcript_21021/g.83816 Transcript_21021/m.83816 type:complete len:193 (+) Transcript_21021:265-843(+)